MTTVEVYEDVGKWTSDGRHHKPEKTGTHHKKTGAASKVLTPLPDNNSQLSPPKLAANYPSEIGVFHLIAWEYSIQIGCA